MRKRHYLLAGLALSMMVSAEAQDAHACGGTFCDSGPSAMPVDQSGENVLFVMDGKTVEAHVQIQYQGAAERFAWIVPMPKVPDVQVGSALLFNALLQGTVPQFGFTQQTDVCDRGNSDSASGAGGAGGGLGMGGAAGAGGSGGGPQVVYEKTVGAFEVVVLQGGTAEEVGKWLVDNNYQNIPTAPEILKDYVNQKYVFVAIKLTAGANSNEIHPLVFRYEGDEPCVPLKLTRVAATEDMAVRTFFLGDDRVVPTNFKHVTLNPARIDWPTMGQNYKQVVSRAVDSSIANGKAFVTEYAGSSNVVGQFMFYSPSWDSATLEGIDPKEVVTKLEQMGLVLCSPYRYSGGGDCQYNHPLVKPLLSEYLPVPAELSPVEFYGALATHADKIDPTKWNAAEFAADFKLRIQEPAKHASDIVSKWPYLTRMFTTISPSEMTEDPMFHAHPGLDPVQPLNMAVQRTNCCGASTMDLGETEIAYDKTTGSWPVWDSAMPWAAQIDEFSLAGDRITLVDNASKISGQIAAWNTENKETCFPPGAKKAASDDTEDMLELAGGPACGVSGRGSSPAAALALALLGVAALVRRRR